MDSWSIIVSLARALPELAKIHCGLATAVAWYFGVSGIAVLDGGKKKKRAEGRLPQSATA